MDKKISFNDLKIHKLFENFYIIPDYQREYVWEEKEVNQLLNDLYDAFSDNSDSEYFLGSIVVCKSVEPTKLEVIDGQQRLITLSLILNNIKRIYKKNDEDPSLIDKMLYSAKIAANGETVNSYIIEIQYEGKEVLYDLYKTDDVATINPKMREGLPGKTIYDSHGYIMDFLNSTFNTEEEFSQIKKFLGYFLNKVKIIQIETPEIGKALKIFETINERGISLDQVDLLKNLLFIQIPRKQFPKLSNYIENSWEGNSNYTPISQYMKSSIHIEHILPETPTKELIDDFSGGDTREYENYKNKIGNRTLLERPINTSIKRDFYSKKLSEYSKSKFYLTRSIKNIEVVGINTSVNRVNKLLKSYDVWNKESIDDRSQMLLNITKRTWVIEKHEEYE